jgi:D-methionine transport system permease protein
VIFVPLLVVSAPYVARIVESSLKEVDKGVIEAAKSMGASTSQIISMVLLPEAKPSLLSNAAIAVSTIFGYTAMAGFIGAEGLGAVALNYGYHHSLEKVLWAAVILLVIAVWGIQSAGLRIAKKADRRMN